MHLTAHNININVNKIRRKAYRRLMQTKLIYYIFTGHYLHRGARANNVCAINSDGISNTLADNGIMANGLVAQRNTTRDKFTFT